MGLNNPNTFVEDISDVKADPKMEGLTPNKTLLALKLTENEEAEPKIITENPKKKDLGIRTIAELFERYKPSVDVEFKTIEGASISEPLRFHNVGDFRPNGIAEQSKFLSEMQLEMDTLLELLQQLSSNNKLRNVLDGKETKAAYIRALEALAAEL